MLWEDIWDLCHLRNHVFTFGPIYSFGVFLPIMKARTAPARASQLNSCSTVLANTRLFDPIWLSGRLGHFSHRGMRLQIALQCQSMSMACKSSDTCQYF